MINTTLSDAEIESLMQQSGYSQNEIESYKDESGKFKRDKDGNLDIKEENVKKRLDEQDKKIEELKNKKADLEREYKEVKSVLKEQKKYKKEKNKDYNPDIHKKKAKQIREVEIALRSAKTEYAKAIIKKTINAPSLTNEEKSAKISEDLTKLDYKTKENIEKEYLEPLKEIRGDDSNKETSPSVPPGISGP